MSLRNARRPAPAQFGNGPLKIEHARQQLNLPRSTSRPRLQYLASRLHALGPKPLFYFLDEIERGAPIVATLERYAALPADFIRANGGGEFAPFLWPIEGGRR
jgi:hypothetical protein